MNRKEIVTRVNQRLDGRLYRWQDIRYEFDDAIDQVNSFMHTQFPMFTDIMKQDDSKYVYHLIKNLDGGFLVFTDLEQYNVVAADPEHVDSFKESNIPVFPNSFIRSIIIPSVVNKLLQREDEFGNLQASMTQEFQIGIQNMFFEYYDKVPVYFTSESGTLKWNSKEYSNPFKIGGEFKNPGFDPLKQGDE